MNIIHIDSIDHPGVEIFSTLTEAQLRNKLEPEKGIFIVESPKVIKVAMQAGYEPVALLTESKHIDGDAADIVSQLGNDIPIYTGSRDVLASLTGYKLTRGVLCAMKRPAPWLQIRYGGRRIIRQGCSRQSTGVCWMKSPSLVRNCPPTLRESSP